MLDRYIDEDYYEERVCRCCDKKQDKLESAKDFLEGVIEALYSETPLDVYQLEDHLEELCGYLDVKLPQKRLQIQRKQSELLQLAYHLTKQYV